MKLNAVLAPVTFLLLAFAAVTVFNHIQAKKSLSESSVTDSSSLISESLIPSSERSLLEESRGLLLTGVQTQGPVSEDYLLLPNIPWEAPTLAKLFRDAGMESACQMLEYGVDVVQPLLPPVAGTAGVLGRQSAFTLSIQVGKDLGQGLPSVTRGVIESYLRSHQITIQTLFYTTADGKLILSPKLRAAFVRLEVPEKTETPEPMIVKSIEELRTLGAYWNRPERFSPELCRTMIVGFRYTLESKFVPGQATPQREYELLFLHLLPDATPQNPKLAVFATSDARTQFHLLEPVDPGSVAQRPGITSEVRFADSRLMGMYPIQPIVTAVRHQALLSIPVDLVVSQADGLPGQEPVEFSIVLDRLYETAMGKAAEPGNSPPVSTPAQPDFSPSEAPAPAPVPASTGVDEIPRTLPAFGNL